LEGLLDPVDRKIGYARREAAARLRQISAVVYGAGRFRTDATRDARSCRAAIGIPAINVTVWSVGILGTGPEHGIPHEHVSVSPERVVKAPRPERKGQKVAGEEGPEDWSSEPPAAATSTVPAAPPVVSPVVPAVIPSPMVPSGPSAQSARAQSVKMSGVNVSDVAARARHAAEIAATDVSGTEPRPTHSSATEMRTAKMRATEMRSVTSEVATTTAAAATTMTARHTRISCEN